ncbi:hypothetical protein CRUP_033480, partial [Coryphaenoides rupestris]
MDRVEKSKEQMDQMRGEVQQERAARQDLECDKMSLERQNKDLKSRVSHLEGGQGGQPAGLCGLQAHKPHPGPGGPATGREELTQRLKTAKRQMDEAEEEIERLENAKKKLQRELDEQIEA